MNIITITGRLSRDPEIKTTSTGSTFAVFYIADERPGKNGEKKTVFHSCTAWGKKGDFVKQYFTKGKPVGVIGSLCMDTYEKNGEKVQFYKVVADQVFFLPTDGTAKTATESQNIPDDAGAVDF